MSIIQLTGRSKHFGNWCVGRELFDKNGMIRVHACVGNSDAEEGQRNISRIA